MTQAQLDMQHVHIQLEQQTIYTDLSTQPLFNDSLVLFLEDMEQDSPNATSDQTSSEHNSNTERNVPQIPSEKQQISPEKHNSEQPEQSHGPPHLHFRKHDMR